MHTETHGRPAAVPGPWVTDAGAGRPSSAKPTPPLQRHARPANTHNGPLDKSNGELMRTYRGFPVRRRRVARALCRLRCVRRHRERGPRAGPRTGPVDDPRRGHDAGGRADGAAHEADPRSRGRRPPRHRGPPRTGLADHRVRRRAAAAHPRRARPTGRSSRTGSTRRRPSPSPASRVSPRCSGTTVTACATRPRRRACCERRWTGASTRSNRRRRSPSEAMAPAQTADDRRRATSVAPGDVIRRAPRPCVAKLKAQLEHTSSRFWKPIRYQRWTTSQVSQAGSR